MSVIAVVSSGSKVGEGGVRSAMEEIEMCAGREDKEVVVWCLGVLRRVVGPL